MKGKILERLRGIVTVYTDKNLGDYIDQDHQVVNKIVQKVVDSDLRVTEIMIESSDTVEKVLIDGGKLLPAFTSLLWDSVHYRFDDVVSIRDVKRKSIEKWEKDSSSLGSTCIC